MTNYAKDHVPDYTQKPNVERLNLLIQAVKTDTVMMQTGLQFRRYLTDLGFEKLGAACSNGHDHGCNRGLGEWLGIEPYGQGEDGSIPWNEQKGISAERLNRYVDPIFVQQVLSSEERTQKAYLVRMLETFRDTNEFIYDWETAIDALPAPDTAQQQAAA